MSVRLGCVGLRRHGDAEVALDPSQPLVHVTELFLGGAVVGFGEALVLGELGAQLA